MSNAYFGEIRLLPFFGNRVPANWMICNGQTLPIRQYTALFSLLGTFYGGDGQTTFGLPDLGGRVPINQGQGPGLSAYNLGQFGGAEAVTLDAGQMAPHTHAVQASTSPATLPNPVGNVATTFATPFYATAAGTAVTIPTTPGGGGQPHSNMAPTIALQYCICIQGEFPTRQ